ncbi:MAG: hypothetical protein HY064_16715 [Bacteroidetes bacterium]|nr:hypothetical protein [Bacteroidota bacterium]
MKKFLPFLLILFFLLGNNILSAGNFPRNDHKHESFQCCPVNAHAGKRAKSRATHIHKKLYTKKTEKIGTYVQSQGQTAPAKIISPDNGTDGTGAGGGTSGAPVNAAQQVDAPQSVNSIRHDTDTDVQRVIENADGNVHDNADVNVTIPSDTLRIELISNPNSNGGNIHQNNAPRNKVNVSTTDGNVIDEKKKAPAGNTVPQRKKTSEDKAPVHNAPAPTGVLETTPSRITNVDVIHN